VAVFCFAREVSTGGKTKKEREYYTVEQKAQNAALNTPTVGEAAMSKDVTDWNNWMAQPGHDIGSAPGMDPYIQIGRGAIERANKDRMGTGALALGEGGSSGYAQQLKEQKKNEMGQQYGAGLENAYAMRNAEVKGSYAPLGQMELGRKMGQLNNTSQMAGLWIQKPRKSPWDYALEGTQTFGPMLFGGFGG
jgi:hypothetical protein